MTQENQVEYQRLGKRELGPYAFEERMPDTLLSKLINEGSSNKLGGVITQLARLLERDKNIETAYLCNDVAVQVSKIPGEGNVFCGYRNIQMQLLALGLPKESISPTPSDVAIPAIQELIERAWDAGFNAGSKIQTGGIRNTRKHIGTVEVEALLRNLGVDGNVHGFYGPSAQEELLDFVESYFSISGTSGSKEGIAAIKSKVRRTNRPPIFLQRPKHSITIIGLEKTRSRKRHLLVFDPAWAPPLAVKKAAATGASSLPSGSCLPTSMQEKWVLRQYRKPTRYLRRFDAFETVSIG